MARNPKSWRQEAGLSLAHVAAHAGIAGANPARTYDRYEKGEQACPATVIERVRELSAGAVGAESWQETRMQFFKAAAGAKQRSPA